MQLFERLRAGAAAPWSRYTGHPFVRALGDGTLPRAKFQLFLIQDYLFLIQYARAWTLLATKLDEPAEMREAMATATALLETELPLHIGTCAGWGIVEAELAAAPPSLELIAYTSYVLATGHSGDALELIVALAPCIAGYAEIAAALAPGLAADNPYRDWVAAYTGADYLGSVAAALGLMERLARRGGAEARLPRLQRIFTQATECEAAFWETGWR